MTKVEKYNRQIIQLSDKRSIYRSLTVALTIPAIFFAVLVIFLRVPIFMAPAVFCVLAACPCGLTAMHITNEMVELQHEIGALTERAALEQQRVIDKKAKHTAFHKHIETLWQLVIDGSPKIVKVIPEFQKKYMIYDEGSKEFVLRQEYIEPSDGSDDNPTTGELQVFMNGKDADEVRNFLHVIGIQYN